MERPRPRIAYTSRVEQKTTEAKFKGANPDLPCLNYGASPKENRSILFLQLFGEYVAIKLPTVALTSVLAMAALAAHENHHVMTLDHKAAYLNAHMAGPQVFMMLTLEVAELVCKVDAMYREFIRPDKKIIVRLNKSLYGCIQSV